MLKILDRYIIRKFLGTFILSIVLILSIVVILDITEKIDKFHDNNAPLQAIIFDYYVNFVPFFYNMLSPLFTFIAVIFVTSKLAGNSEIIAIQASGVSYNRLLRPYFIGAAIIAVFSFLLSGYIIPPANKTRLEFENQYVKRFKSENVRNVQLEVEKGVILYIDHFDANSKTGYRTSMEKFDGKKLVSRMTAERMIWDTLYQWRIEDYLIREFEGMSERITQGKGLALDTVIPMEAKDFLITTKESSQMNNTELSEYLNRQQKRGIGNIKAFQDEYYKRFSMSFASFILTLIGVSLSSKKVRGGTGVNLGIGLALSATYVLFSTFSSSFSINGTMSPLLAAWLPNIVYSIIAISLYWKAPK